jgi:hypothetical protein
MVSREYRDRGGRWGVSVLRVWLLVVLGRGADMGEYDGEPEMINDPPVLEDLAGDARTGGLVHALDLAITGAVSVDGPAAAQIAACVGAEVAKMSDQGPGARPSTDAGDHRVRPRSRITRPRGRLPADTRDIARRENQ